MVVVGTQRVKFRLARIRNVGDLRSSWSLYLRVLNHGLREVVLSFSADIFVKEFFPTKIFNLFLDNPVALAKLKQLGGRQTGIQQVEPGHNGVVRSNSLQSNVGVGQRKHL